MLTSSSLASASTTSILGALTCRQCQAPGAALIGCTQCEVALCATCADAQWGLQVHERNQFGSPWCPCCQEPLQEVRLAMCWPAERWAQFRRRRLAHRAGLSRDLDGWARDATSGPLRTMCRRLARHLAAGNAIERSLWQEAQSVAVTQWPTAADTPAWWKLVGQHHVYPLTRPVAETLSA